MVSTRKKKELNKKLLSRLIEYKTEFKIWQNNHGTQTQSGVNTMLENITLIDANISTQANTSEEDVHTLERSIVSKFRSQVDDVMTTVKTRARTALESLVIPRVSLARKSDKATSRSDSDSVVPNPDREDFSAFTEGLQMTAWKRISSKTDLNKTDETRGNNSVKGGDLSDNERNFGRQSHTHSSQFPQMGPCSTKK